MALKLSEIQGQDIIQKQQEKLKKYLADKSSSSSSLGEKNKKIEEFKKAASKAKKVKKESDPATLEKIKKTSVDTEILNSLKSCIPVIKKIEHGVIIQMPGVRIYTLNQILAILQYKKFHMFSYKKECHNLMSRAFEKDKKIKLNPPFKLSLYRRGKKKVDNDSLAAMFKFFIDGLKTDKKKSKLENSKKIIQDDNAEIIETYDLFQETGDPLLVLKIEEIKLEKKDIKSIFKL